MMKRILAISLCLTFIGVVNVFAQNETPENKLPEQQIATGQEQAATAGYQQQKRHYFAFGPEISYIKYEEPGVMKETGIMYGIAGSYAYRNGIILKIEGKFACGQLDYDGSTWGGTPLKINSIPNYMLEPRGLLGWDFTAGAVTITPYAGIGYRYLNDNMQEKYSGGYKRESNYLYLPLGLEFAANFGSGWSLEASGEYDLFIWGKQKSYLSDAIPGAADIENKQNQGYGARGSILIAKKGERVGFKVGPYVNYWNIADSERALFTYSGVLYSGYEPKNNSTEIGCKLVVMF